MDTDEATAEWYGAGVIPFSITRGGEIFILLGKEDTIPACKMNSNKWCDFSGGRDPSDPSPEYTAAREYHEETAGLPMLWGSQTVEQFANMLKQDNAYFCKLDRNSGNSSKCPAYVIQLPFHPHMSREYDMHREQLIKLKIYHREYMESVKDLDPKLVHLEIGANLEAGTVIKLLSPRDCVLMDKTKNMEIHYRACEFESPALFEKGASIFSAYCKWMQCYMSTADSFKSSNAVHTSILRSAKTGIEYLIGMEVKDCYLEKQCIDWHSLDWLREAVSNGGTFGSESFRISFAPLLSVLLDIFNNLHNPQERQYIIDIRPWSMSATLSVCDPSRLASDIDS